MYSYEAQHLLRTGKIKAVHSQDYQDYWTYDKSKNKYVQYWKNRKLKGESVEDFKNYMGESYDWEVYNIPVTKSKIRKIKNESP